MAEIRKANVHANSHRILWKKCVSAEIYKTEGAKELEAFCVVRQNIWEEERMLNISRDGFYTWTREIKQCVEATVTSNSFPSSKSYSPLSFSKDSLISWSRTSQRHNVAPDQVAVIRYDLYHQKIKRKLHWQKNCLSTVYSPTFYKPLTKEGLGACLERIWYSQMFIKLIQLNQDGTICQVLTNGDMRTFWNQKWRWKRLCRSLSPLQHLFRIRAASYNSRFDIVLM